MKTLVLVLALVFVVAGASMATTSTASFSIYQGWTMIGCPLVPVNLALPETDPNYDMSLDYTEPYFAFDEVQSDLDYYKLQRWDAPSASWKKYLADQDFGKLLLGDGYFLKASAGTTITYPGLEDGVPYTDPNTQAKTKTDMWISLPGFKGDGTTSAGGWHMISTPFATDVPAYTIDANDNVTWRIFFTDGNTIKDWMAASDPTDPNSWVSDTFKGFENNNETQVSYNLDTYTLKAGRGYWFRTKKDDLAMIIKAY